MALRHLVIGTITALSLLLVSGCSSEPAKPDVAPTSTHDIATALTPSPTPTKTIVPVTTPWQPGQFQKGIQIYWHANGEPLDGIITRAERILDHVVATGANSVGITFPLYVDGPSSNTVRAGIETPSVAELAVVIAAAKQRNLRVLLRATIDETNLLNIGEWRGSITPSDVDSWFASYTGTLMPYWQMAQTTGADEISLGVELSSMEQYTDNWQALQQAASEAFSGTISYAVNWDEYAGGGPIESFAVDAYPRTTLNDDASVDDVTAAWQSWLSLRPVESRRSIALQEVGIAAESGRYSRPWEWGGDGELNLDIQSNWFTAVCRAAKESETAGIYYWMIDSNIDFDSLDPLTDPVGSFVGRPAEASIVSCFA